MKYFTPEIAWHNRDPVFSIDIQPDKVSESTYRLASGGADTHVVIWFVEYNFKINSKSLPKIEAVADLTRHQKAVNVVRFSPSSEFLASGDDDSVILIWKKKNPDFLDSVDSENNNKEHWACIKTLRLHIKDICDISWSPNSTYLISGSVDNTAIIWDVNTGNSTDMFKEHKGFVQGVSWDPLQKYVATLCSDRTLRLYSVSHKALICQCSKIVLPWQKTSETNNAAVRIFHDDTLKTYFRRLCFSPDGSLLFVPCGILDLSCSQSNLNTAAECKLTNATFLFARNSFNEPIMYYPSGDKYSVAVRCCPILFQKTNTEKNNELLNLPYKIVFAVATKSSVIFYDTEHAAPFGYVTDMHYTRLTDVSWSNDGLLLVVSSTDGYCTFIAFNEGELGDRWQENSSNTDRNEIHDSCKVIHSEENFSE